MGEAGQVADVRPRRPGRWRGLALASAGEGSRGKMGVVVSLVFCYISLRLCVGVVVESWSLVVA